MIESLVWILDRQLSPMLSISKIPSILVVPDKTPKFP